MNDQTPLDEAWVIELHPLGGSRYRQTRDVYADALKKFTHGQATDWTPVAIATDIVAAQRELARLRRLFRTSETQTAVPSEDRKPAP
jgi:hypothetical protein